MRRLAVMSMVVLAAATWAAPADADDKLVAALKALGKAVDDMSANISNAQTDADAELLSRVTREALDHGLKQGRPTITIDASAGYCRVTIATPQWDLWSEARAGRIVSHGAKIH